jgi:hypothetical protein
VEPIPKLRQIDGGDRIAAFVAALASAQAASCSPQSNPLGREVKT